MKKRILFLIDCQLDFIDGGKLGVNNSTEKMDALAQYIRDTKGKYDAIFASVDWHPSTHCSFKPNGGIWPPHCVQFSTGAAIYQPILDAINEIGADFHVFSKGNNEDREEYSVMKNPESNKIIHAFFDSNGIDNVDFVGIADIYCVKDSIEDFHRNLPDINIGVIPAFVGNMDEKKFIDFIEKNDYIEIKNP